eukprot:Plantae.Rhodophyta-Hildenbrandia_rubra.ctg18412.p1 GENE.Plantae.Rhodophyta-Hildenbrandia_rubra.ctg18412~~Plantae.Rhodophyta-Hildenbrandia_rubra.ctg18412.p1  ORF type:complete len:273 (+),score=48.45 Plantae.Rhodophyta-Hildenbrandia_rubra.ctg18412:308-1126(+)
MLTFAAPSLPTLTNLRNPLYSNIWQPRGETCHTKRSSRWTLPSPRHSGAAIFLPHIPERRYNTLKASLQAEKAIIELKDRLKRCNVYFVGCMGSGKTVVAQNLAIQLGYRYIDTDEIIEKLAGKSIREIFESDGEEEFRKLEVGVLDVVQAYVACCISTGGGIVMRKENWGKLQTGLTVWLDVPVDVLVKRLEGDDTRPLLVGEDLQEKLSDILEKRTRMYKQADVRVHVDEDMDVGNVVAETVRTINNFIKSHPPRHSKLFPKKFPDVSRS